MTLYINENDLLVKISFSQSNLEIGVGYTFSITSQYSHQPLLLEAECILSNIRYSSFRVAFPIGFGDAHKNGIYDWDLVFQGVSLEKGIVKIITEPGGGMNTLTYNPGANTNERVSEVFFRPNY